MWRACRMEPTPRPPVWLMRQAGRYMASYRRVRRKLSMLELCLNPSAAAGVAVDAVERLGVDAGIVFSDLLLPALSLGIHVSYPEKIGPRLVPALDSLAAVRRLPRADLAPLAPVLEAVRQTRQSLPQNIPLIGFSGAPFTLAAYLIEGGGSKNFLKTKSFMYAHPADWHRFLSRLVDLLVYFLSEQAQAGAQILQVFDSWVGILSDDDYRTYVQPHSRRLFQQLPVGVPTIHFGTGAGSLLESMAAAGGDVMGLDWRTPLKPAWDRVPGRGLMGNLDPAVLCAPLPVLRRMAREVLRGGEGRRGYIFNLGHGVFPETSEAQARELVRYVQGGE